MVQADNSNLKSLRESEEKYRKMIEMASDAIFSIEPDDGTILEANLKAEELTGFKISELIGKKVWELHPEFEQQNAKQLFQDVVESGRGYTSELHFLRKDKTLLNIEISAGVVNFGNKKIIQRICRDITNRVLLQRENRRLREYYEYILDQMPVGLGVRKNINSRPEVEFENKKLKEIFDQAIDEGCPCSWEQSIGDQRIESEQILSEDGVYVEERKFPNDRVYQFTTGYFRDADHNWRELNIVQDVTTRNRLEQELKKANEELEQKVEERTRELRQKQAQLVQAEKMAALGNLVAGVAHEVNTPLGALSSNNDLFIRSLEKLKAMVSDSSAPAEFRESEELKKLLKNMEELTDINKTASSRIIDIVSSLRKFARLDQAEMDTVDIHEGIENTLTLVHHQLKNRVEVERDYGDLPKISCYPNQLNQVFMNILVNASQAIEGKGKIFVKTRRKNDNAVIEISDTGRGIPEDKLERIFDPGYTTKGAGVGTGLGLSIVHQIIEDHNGRIEVESKVNEGTTFRIVIPIGGNER
ncbi:MAG: PAS domain S-box protein [Aliifodinibius sp.]|nr:PAS domain S-box protein [candidate division Zixibacteria bacterium]NIT59983.1 PAS domain S-box protein [Fodinibius sp.]NIW42225.1 PAS domain S-box protein [candidate division Zixibacteria bacterium]NIY28566.1 PAS domain S-box protein [Fodinibius sp.]